MRIISSILEGEGIGKCNLEAKKPKTETSTKTTTKSSLNNVKKSPPKPTEVSKSTTSSKDEELRKTTSTRTSTLTNNLKRVPNGKTSKPVPIKPSPSRSSSTTRSTTMAKAKPGPTHEKPSQPSKVKQIPATSKSIPTKTSSSRPNSVMTRVHNVTVSSPPSKRKEIPIPTIVEKDEPPPQARKSKSNLIHPDKGSIPKDKVVEQTKKITENVVEAPVKVKEPVAFDVVFGERQNNKEQVRKPNSPIPSDSSPEYDEDFESYESDFETGSSSAEVVSEDSSSSESSSHDNRDEPLAISETEPESEDHSDEDEESELTQFPITVIHRDREQERKLDSGHYDLNSKKRRTLDSFDSLDTLANCEQLDSGISYEGSIPTVSTEPVGLVLGGYHRFYSHPKITKRGLAIMSKIQFDSISFTLLELKPIAYDTFMRLFGASNTLQSSTQTRENYLDTECQTDESEMRSIWTQHPPQYSFETHSCTSEHQEDTSGKSTSDEDPFDNTIKVLSKLKSDTPFFGRSNRHKQINFERLNMFLNTSSQIISQIVSTNTQDLRLDTTELKFISNGFYKLNTLLLNALKVIRVFANAKFNLILTVHESIANVYQNDFSNLIMVWNSSDASKPLRLLSTWSEVCRAEICNESSDIVICGLRDGSVSMWDLRETYSFCSKLDGHLTHFAATHSIAPNWGETDMRSIDFGAIVDVKSFRSTPKTNLETFKTVQFASLNETGILTIWTLVETGARNYEICQSSDSKFEYSSPWARVKLIQSAICDLREYIELGTVRTSSAFERTKSNFQKQIFEDDILRELAETSSDIKLGLQGLRFTNLDCGTERIFVGTNRNFIICCSKSLKKERFRKINIVDSGFLFPTAIKLLENEIFLVIGLSNGSVMILNCNQEKTNKQYPDKSRRPGTAGSRSTEFDFEIGKSCAIQNIIRNERRSSEDHFVEHDFRPSTATLIEATIEGNKKPYELRVFDEQILLNGSVLRKDLVQNLEISSDGWTLFSLSDGDVRGFDFYTEKEVPLSTKSSGTKIVDIAVNRGVGEEKKLILLNDNNDVQVHLLK